MHLGEQNKWSDIIGGDSHQCFSRVNDIVMLRVNVVVVDGMVAELVPNNTTMWSILIFFL